MNSTTLDPDLEYYIGKLQPPYELKAQAKIGRMLDQYGIPFYYKHPMLVFEDGRRMITRPDFTLPTYNNTVIDYRPRNDAIRGRMKSDLYRQNGIAAFSLDQSDLDRPNWQGRLYNRLEKAYRQPLTYWNASPLK